MEYAQEIAKDENDTHNVHIEVNKRIHDIAHLSKTLVEKDIKYLVNPLSFLNNRIEKMEKGFIMQIKMIHDKVYIPSIRFVSNIIGIDLSVAISSTSKVQKEITRKVIYDTIIGKRKLKRVVLSYHFT